jgi:acetate kinase
MAAHSHCLLTINGGSSSIRFALFSAGAELRRLMSGRIERIGLSGTTLRSVGADPAQQETQPMPTGDHQSAATTLLDWLGARVERGTLVAIGHRIVHGGPDGNEPQRLTPELLARLKALKALDPEHLPLELGIVEAMQARYPGVAQLACFDTAFHRDLPRVARLLAIPRRYEAAGVRRYGFHGLSYEYLLGELARLNQAEVASGRLILAHLGNGSSITAVHRGRSIDTTMAFTPAAGLPMSTRSGDLDPGLGSYLARTEAMSAAQFARMTTRESGLLGISETSADMRDLLEHEASDVRAREAVELYCYQVRKQIGAYAAALGGMDALVFTGGIGENAPSIRARICEGLSFLGILVDPRRNAVNAALISSDSARVKLRVIATDEELVIARAVQRALPAIRGPDP